MISVQWLKEEADSDDAVNFKEVDSARRFRRATEATHHDQIRIPAGWECASEEFDRCFFFT